MDNVSLTTRDLRFAYGTTDILHGLDLTFEPGKLHAIVGPNGSGKSTLLDLLGGHRTPEAGEVSINTVPISEHSPERLARLVAMVPQEFDFNFPFSVLDTVLMGRHPHIPRFSRPAKQDLDTVWSAMRTMDIAHLAHRSVAELSGGEKQRTVFARAMAQDAPCLLLDEPTSSMDIRHALAAMHELGQLASRGRTVVAVLHDLNLAAACCDNVAVLQDGRIFAQGNSADILTPEVIREVFGVGANIVPHPETDTPIIAFTPKEHS